MVLMRSRLTRAFAARIFLAAAVLCGTLGWPALARVYIGLGVPLFFPPPVVVAPPAYYPPPAYPAPGSTFSYTPPSAGPQSLAPPRGYAPGGYYTPSMGGDPGYADPGYSAQSCHAGAYVCPLMEETPPGGSCACPGHGGRRIRGQAD